MILRVEYRAYPIKGSPKLEAWPTRKAFDNHPIDLIDPTNPDLDRNNSRNWRRAFKEEGTPGRDSDSDDDGLDDHWKNHFFRSLDSLPSEDADGDRLNNLAEQRLFTNPTLEDTDEDGLLDQHETAIGILISNLMEFLTVTDPRDLNVAPLSVRPIYPDSGKIEKFEASFFRHRNPGNAFLQLEISENLISWELLPTIFDRSDPFNPSIEVADENREKTTYRISQYPSPKFLRLRAKFAP